ncbi:acyl-CoA transferase/carnitine dehydratase [Mycolicibacterium fortuitum subsp. acetamidolyticum]|jgi:crotonobetainyl-CoA:carnitine CoA-transferase CaiB-like acyl-CoA transferase|uniref:Caib/baif family protein n=4 Tax=Mycolicibacterium fortuitum TaxID=1766 RepID=A0A378UV70_MYCFO|nr:L-carnitine dehydratase/bile acid-inducible protein F [Mycobacterium sp. VKM Ac-1817D]EJZ05539.1 caib/baif family protein [Mycolicibacterium fortuitum subsp. fortuitum DSM 46621 = ATCC 6841 = JCM 6387]CRL79117.1 caib/baif family protein [Mycolicibacter nonchromogenicus]STZ87959.1 caib/baif family protein [Mycolicibacterium fortuitum]BDD99965.1 CoA transferase [Mycolicibacterium fortuitum subsp. fortuitum]GAT02338.1 acyl-CoA transferase/carnitine dehydratase [Mycolicibacterium fortuitum subs
MGGMLGGIRVLDLATLAAAPLAATYLGEFGADVIKVEQPGQGDPIRTWGNQRDGVGLMWKSVSRNKRSVTANLRVAEGQDLVRRLVEKSDVVIVNTRPQTLVKWGLDYESLRAVNDGIVMLHITGFGLSGPKSERPGFGTLGEAMSGFAHVTGEAEGPPTLPPFMLADGVASLNAAYAVMMALYHRDVHGARGQLIDVNLVDPLARLLEQNLLGYDQLGIVPSRAGNRWDISAPRNTYRTSDGRWLAMSGSSPALALRVFRAIGRDDLVSDADFSDPQRRLARAAEVDAMVAKWVAAHSLSEAMAAFDAAEVAAAPVYDIAQLVADEQLRHREVFVSVADDELGAMTVQAPVPRFSGQSGKVDTLGPRLGEHNAEVYHELLGLTDEEIGRLRADGVL